MWGCVELKRLFELALERLVVELVDLIGEDLYILMLLFNQSFQVDRGSVEMSHRFYPLILV